MSMPSSRIAAMASGSLHQTCLNERPMVEGLESLFHSEMRHQLSRRDDPSMCHLETGFPGHQLDFCPPDRADQHETFLRTREAHATTEAEEPCVANNGTSLLQDLSAKRLLPRLIT